MFNIQNVKKDHLFKYRFLSALGEFAKHPIGVDSFAKLSCAALIEFSKKNSTLIDVIVRSRELRPLGSPLTLQHAVNLATVHAINYIQIWIKGNSNYPYDPKLKLRTITGWKKIYKEIVSNYLDLYSEIMQTKDIQTTNIQRGVAFPWITHRIFCDKKIRVLDLGCSANLIWQRLTHNQNGDFYAKDFTLHQQVMKHASDSINISKEIGIDHVDPFRNRESIRWFLSCRHIREVTAEKLKSMQTQIKSYRKSYKNKTKIIEGDILEKAIGLGFFDMVTASTVMYQLTKSQRRQLIEMTPNFLDPNGVMIVQDYCKSNKHGGLTFIVGAEEYAYKTSIMGPKLTNGKWLTILEYRTSMCDVIRQGPDFDEFIKITKKQNK